MDPADKLDRALGRMLNLDDPPLADRLEPRKHARIHVTVTRSLAFAALCGIARAPRFWLGWVVGSWLTNAGWLLAHWLP